MSRDEEAAIDWWSLYPLPPESKRAHVRVNFISSADGAATLEGRSGDLGGAGDRALMNVLRSLSDVVMVGAGTVRAEGYGGLNLPDSHLRRRAELGLSHTPRMAIVSNALNLAPELSVFTKAEAHPLIITHAAAPSAKIESFESVADVLICGDTEVDLGKALTALSKRGLPRVLCEGGPRLFGSLLEGDHVDEVCLTVSPLFIAGTEPRIAHSGASLSRKFRAASLLSDCDGFVFLRYARDRSTPGLNRVSS